MPHQVDEGAGSPSAATVRPSRASANVGAASGAHERRVTSIWEQVLGREGIGANDNFFDLGGTSALLLQVYGMLVDEAVDQPLKVPDLFRYPTVASLARRLGQTGSDVSLGIGRASNRRAQLTDGTARNARLRARERHRADTPEDQNA